MKDKTLEYSGCVDNDAHGITFEKKLARPMLWISVADRNTTTLCGTGYSVSPYTLMYGSVMRCCFHFFAHTTSLLLTYPSGVTGFNQSGWHYGQLTTPQEMWCWFHWSTSVRATMSYLNRFKTGCREWLDNALRLRAFYWGVSVSVVRP